MTYYGLAPQLMQMPGGMSTPAGYEFGQAGGQAMVGAPLTAGPGQGATATPAIPAEAKRQQAAALLQHCYRWLESAVPIVPQTAELVPVLVTAVQQYEAQQYDACMAQAVAVVHTVRQLRTAVPALPPL